MQSMEDKDLKCVCGKSKDAHKHVIPWHDIGCFKHGNGCICHLSHKYQLDNLLHIERLAKERKLI